MWDSLFTFLNGLIDKLVVGLGLYTVVKQDDKIDVLEKQNEILTEVSSIKSVNHNLSDVDLLNKL